MGERDTNDGTPTWLGRTMCQMVFLVGGTWAVAACAFSAEEGAWSTTGTRHFVISRAAESSWPAQVGSVRIYPYGKEGDTGPSATLDEVLVTTPDGRPVSSRVLWSAPGAPMDVLFDCHDDVHTYFVYPGHAAPGRAAPGWQPLAGVVLETRSRPEMQMLTAEEFRAAWRKAEPATFGRTLVPQIFDGLNRLGPSVNYLSVYRGIFPVASQGTYRFATISDDGSFVLVDGAVVCAWPGYHGADNRGYGEHQGSIALAPGMHVVDYYQYQGGGPSVSELVWSPPGTSAFTVMPPQAFAPVATYSALHLENRDVPERTAFSWEIQGQTSTNPDAQEAPALVDVRLRLLENTDRVARWTFDDGASTQGREVDHLFTAIGHHLIRVRVGDAVQDAANAVIDVHPRWAQLEEIEGERWKHQETALLARDLSTMPPAAMQGLLTFSEQFPDLALINHCGDGIRAHMGDFTGAYAAVLVDQGLDYQWPQLRNYPAAREVLSACAQMKGAPPAVRARAGLHLGGLLIYAFYDAPAAQAQLDLVQGKDLSSDDQRLLGIYRGDALLAAGALEKARACYLAVGSVSAPGDVKAALVRRTRLESAHAYLRQGDVDAAEGILRAIEWEDPSERLGTQTGLLLAEVWRARKELPFALNRCRLMLVAAPDDVNRSDILLEMVRIHLAAGASQDAVTLAHRLLTDHPYSEAAARVKDLLAAAGAKP